MTGQWLGTVNSVLKKSESGDGSWVLEMPKTYETRCLEGVCVCAQKEGNRAVRSLAASGVRMRKDRMAVGEVFWR